MDELGVFGEYPRSFEILDELGVFLENIQGASKEFVLARHGFLIKSMTKQKLTYPWKPLLGVWVGFLALEGLVFL